MLAPRLNSIIIIDEPRLDTELIRSTLSKLASCFSMGVVKALSTSAGLAPGQTTETTTVSIETFGKNRVLS